HRILERIPDARVVNLDALTYAGNPANVRGLDARRYRFVKGNIANTPLMRALMREADIVVNFAAETHVDRSIHESSKEFVMTNVVGVHSLLEALLASPNIRKMVHISTDEVWGDLPLRSKSRFVEESEFRPNSPYAASKASGDLLIRSYMRTYGAPVIVTHSVNNYGPRQYPEKLIPFFILRALKDEPLPLYGTGENMRDWLHVNDHSDAIILVLESGNAGEIYNISQQQEHSNKYIAKKILRILGKPLSLITCVEDRPGHDMKYAVDSSKLRSLGWRPRRSLKEDLPEVIQWFREHLPLGVSSASNMHLAYPLVMKMGKSGFAKQKGRYLS
ncbi:dTDP-glucose 4,6-dehydratase, partial [Candidatus Kaiserbacteria bacterium RIFCSPLOWO2_02_FULL_59_19]